jgi:hypothetical protein
MWTTHPVPGREIRPLGAAVPRDAVPQDAAAAGALDPDPDPDPEPELDPEPFEDEPLDAPALPAGALVELSPEEDSLFDSPLATVLPAPARLSVR